MDSTESPASSARSAVRRMSVDFPLPGPPLMYQINAPFSGAANAG